MRIRANFGILPVKVHFFAGFPGLCAKKENGRERFSKHSLPFLVIINSSRNSSAFCVLSWRDSLISLKGSNQGPGVHIAGTLCGLANA